MFNLFGEEESKNSNQLYAITREQLSYFDEQLLHESIAMAAYGLKHDWTKHEITI